MTNYLQGIDVSHYNGHIDWANVLADPAAPKFVYMKATQGDTFVDPQYAAYRAGAKAEGLLCGAYHFFAPDKPVKDQVDSFVKVVGSVKDELPPMLDIEQAGLAPQQYLEAITAWLLQVGDLLSCTPAIYTSASEWKTNLHNLPFPHSRLWVSHYTANPQPALPPDAAGYTFWQYSQSGTVSGIDGHVDMSRYPGTPEGLHQLVGC
jgi:lysozyme